MWVEGLVVVKIFSAGFGITYFITPRVGVVGMACCEKFKIIQKGGYATYEDWDITLHIGVQGVPV